MTPDVEAELLSKIELLLDIARRQDARLGSLEAGQKSLEAGQKALEAGQKALEMRQSMLEHSVDSLRKDVVDANKEFATFRMKEFGALREYIAEFRGEVRGRVDGLAERISDVNSRLPVPIAYAPPTKPAA